MDCIFCKIVNKEVPNYTVYEDDYVLAFLDIHPCSKGHTVIIPKKHFINLAEMNREDWQNTLEGVRLTMEKIEKILQPDGINIAINDRPAAGQVVPHVHWHILPRWAGDGGGSLHSIIRPKAAIQVDAIAKLFLQ